MSEKVEYKYLDYDIIRSVTLASDTAVVLNNQYAQKNCVNMLCIKCIFETYIIL